MQKTSAGALRTGGYNIYNIADSFTELLYTCFLQLS